MDAVSIPPPSAADAGSHSIDGSGAGARGGERPSSVVASYGFNRTTIYRWLKTQRAKPGVGLRVAARQAERRVRPRKF